MLTERRRTPRWLVGTFGCTTCGHEHVGVAPFPTWAVGPGPVECPKCETRTCLVVRNGCTAEPWILPPGFISLDPTNE
jgi:transcription elongation factor Elf1